jgi:hypothetical protein
MKNILIGDHGGKRFDVYVIQEYISGFSTKVIQNSDH